MSDGCCYCGHHDALAVSNLRRAPRATWWLAGPLTRVGRDAIRRQAQAAFDAWSAVARVTGREAVSELAADLVIRVAQIDGRQGVLADCHLPGPRQQLMRLDDSEAWTVQPGPDVDAALIDLGRVLIHELGHFWGLGHAPPGSPNLMAPTYSRAVWLPQAWEVEAMQALYGRPDAPPPPPAPPAPSKRTVITIDWETRQILSEDRTVA